MESRPSWPPGSRWKRKGRKQRRNLRRLHADLVAFVFKGLYDRVAAFARSWSASATVSTQQAPPTNIPTLGEYALWAWLLLSMAGAIKVRPARR